METQRPWTDEEIEARLKITEAASLAAFDLDPPACDLSEVLAEFEYNLMKEVFAEREWIDCAECMRANDMCEEWLKNALTCENRLLNLPD